MLAKHACSKFRIVKQELIDISNNPHFLTYERPATNLTGYRGRSQLVKIANEK